AKDAPAGQARGATELASDARRLREDVRRERHALLEAGRAKSGTADQAAPRPPRLESGRGGPAGPETPARGQGSAADQEIGGGGDPELRKLIAAELDRAAKLAEQTREVSETFDRAADELAQKELARVRGQLLHVVERSRLGRIDSVIGEKRKLEKEIEQLT